MGKNLYETPRDMNKWHVQKKDCDKTYIATADEKKAHLDELKRRFQKGKK